MALGPRRPAAAQDKVKVGVFPVSSSLPYFVALERGFFKEQNIEPEMIRLIGGPPNVAAMITNQIDVSAVLVTIEGMNANIKKPGVAMYISINSQNKKYQMEQFVVRKGLEAKTLADSQGQEDHVGARARQRHDGQGRARRRRPQGRRLHHRPARHGPARQRHDGRHLRRRLHARAQRLDMRKIGVATTIEAGVIAKYILGDPNANAFVGGLRLHHRFHQEPAGRGQALHRGLGQGGRLHQRTTRPRRASISLKNTFTPDDVVDTVPMIRYFMAKDLTAKDKADYQKFIDFSVKIGVRSRRSTSPNTSRRSEPDGDDGAVADLRTERGGVPVGAPPRRGAPHVTIRGLTKRFAKAVDLRQFDLDIPRGKLISVFGPNGCGKSTLINMIAGLIPPDAGEILFDGKPLREIKFGYVFQNYREALFPWLRVGRQHRVSAQADEGPEGRAARPGREAGRRISASRSTSIAIPTRCPAASSS